jgi:hypothetical protein
MHLDSDADALYTVHQNNVWCSCIHHKICIHHKKKRIKKLNKMNQENILSQSKQKFLSEALVTSMNRGNPFPVSVNCRTFHSFVFFGLMDPEVFEAMDQNDDQPWREEENWDRWGISRDDDRLRQEEFAFFQMHCDKCLKQYNYKVKLHPEMGLGLFARSPELTYYHLDPEDQVILCP